MKDRLSTKPRLEKSTRNSGYTDAKSSYDSVRAQACAIPNLCLC